MFKRVGIGGGASSVAVVSVTLALGVFVTPAAGQTPGEPVLVPGGGGDDMSLRSVSCASETDCVAVGLTVEGRGEDFTSHSWVVRISRGTIGAIVKVSKRDAFLTDVACPTAGNCIAVGSTVVPIRDGTPGDPITVPGVDRLYGVACWTASDCVAVGRSRGQSIVVPISDGNPQTPVAVPGVSGLLAVACATATCQAVGLTIPQGQYRPAGAVVPISNGKPGTPTTVPEALEFDGIACPSATACLVGGQAGSPEDPSAVSMPLTDGARGPVTTVNGPQFLPTLACKSASECLAIGGRGLDGGETNGFFVVPFTDRRPGDARLYPEGNYGGLACAGTAGCLAVGFTEAGAAVLPFGLKIAPFTSVVKPALEQVASPQKGLTIAKLLSRGASTELFKTPVAGKLAIAWYQGKVPAGAAKTTLVAVGKRTFTEAGKAKVAVKLTKAGKRLLKGAKRKLKLASKASFTPTGGETITTKPRKFTLKP
jgi:hypothetical protein